MLQQQHTQRKRPKTAMTSRKRTRSPSADDVNPFRSALDLLRSIPSEIRSRRVYPYAVHVIETRDEARRALDYHISIADTPGWSFPEGYSPIAEWDVSNVTNVVETREELKRDVDHHVWIATSGGRSFPFGYRPIGELDVSRITDFSYVFSIRRNEWMRHFNEEVGDWDVSNGTDFTYMFYGCEQFDADLSRWNVSNGTYFYYMFGYCTCFNSDVSGWDVSNGIDFLFMFASCRRFNSDVSRWNVRVTDPGGIDGMFLDCPAFDRSFVRRWNPEIQFYLY